MFKTHEENAHKANGPARLQVRYCILLLFYLFDVFQAFNKINAKYNSFLSTGRKHSSS